MNIKDFKFKKDIYPKSNEVNILDPDSNKKEDLTAVRMAEINAQTEKDTGERNADLRKFNAGIAIIISCLVILVVLYIVDLVFSIFNIETQTGNNIFTIISYIATTTLGFMFAEYRKK